MPFIMATLKFLRKLTNNEYSPCQSPVGNIVGHLHDVEKSVAIQIEAVLRLVKSHSYR